MGDTLEIAPGYRPTLAAHGLDSMAGVFCYSSGERLDKEGLEGWRERIRLAVVDTADARVETCGVPAAAVTGATAARRKDGKIRTFYLKRFDHPPLRRQIQGWLTGGLRRSAAGREWRNARLLAEAGIPAAEAVAFGQEMWGPFERRSFIVLREVPGESLERWVPANLTGPAEPQQQDPAPTAIRHSDPLPQISSSRLDAASRARQSALADRKWERRRRRIDVLARFVAAFHRAGFVHRDLYLSHIFIDERKAGEPDTSANMDESAHPGIEQHGRTTLGAWDAPKSQPAFRLIDLQRVFRPRWRRLRWIIKDLAALHDSTPLEYVSLKERLRFLCRYARECSRFGRPRELAIRIDRRSRQSRGPTGGPAATRSAAGRCEKEFSHQHRPGSSEKGTTNQCKTPVGGNRLSLPHDLTARSTGEVAITAERPNPQFASRNPQ